VSPTGRSETPPRVASRETKYTSIKAYTTLTRVFSTPACTLVLLVMSSNSLRELRSCLARNAMVAGAEPASFRERDTRGGKRPA